MGPTRRTLGCPPTGERAEYVVFADATAGCRWHDGSGRPRAYRGLPAPMRERWVCVIVGEGLPVTRRTGVVAKTPLESDPMCGAP